ncbi:hypothetical protein [Lyngbya aestuarii]
MFAESLNWNNAMLGGEFNLSYDVSTVLEQDLLELPNFIRPLDVYF